MLCKAYSKKGGLWLSFFLCWASVSQAVELSELESQHIAQLIFQNECNAKEACLTAWNQGEEFASMGIGHFIWYPSDIDAQQKNFDESFPKLLAFMQRKGVHIDTWMQQNPWHNRDEFEQNQQSKKMKSLRHFLLKTRDFQVLFIKKRMENALPMILEHISQIKAIHIRQQFERVAASPMGFYALMDYVNFKGEGIKASESYQGHGWGLLQVLEAMHGEQVGMEAMQDFSTSANHLLQQRVALSPPARHEQRWLKGWQTRVQSYVRHKAY